METSAMASLSASNHVARVLSVANHVADVDASSRIASSWRRCLVNHKLDPARQGPPQTFTEAEVRHAAEPMEETIRLVTPELDDLACALRDAGYCVNLADANATMLFSRLPGEADARQFLDWKIYTGSNFAETFEGTNGLGTALAEQKPILVHRDEHFRAQWHIFSCAVAPLFDQAGRLAGAVNITSCREDLERTAHQLALAVTMQATRRMEGAIFRTHFRSAWIATVPGDGGSGLIAYDDDRRVVGACRSARALLGLTDGMIASGIDVSRYVRFDHQAVRGTDELVELRRADGSPLGQGHLAPPMRARPIAPRRDAPVDRFDALHRLAGRDPEMVKSVKRLGAVIDRDLPVLLQGETGVGKDVFARAIHAGSNRARSNYIALNCAAMPESLIDAELFGYEAGAFTGARRDGSKGLIVQAHGGTLFLDEIGDMPIALQTRLLRVLENREVWPLGALKPVAVDIRLISATHRDLGRMAEEGAFRADLYFRLRGIAVRLPALRERADRDDIIRQIAREEAPGCRLSDEAWSQLAAYPYPGNMRQLRHVLRLAGCTAEDGVITDADLDLPPFGGRAAESDLAAAERATIVGALRAHGGRVAEAARALKLSRATLYRKIKQLKIESV
ncbi:sigma-54-dependent Fis family transcriptional regulator [Bradyrhizobium sp. WBOS7]|uniref:Sigma-54-dependent Fis family transcriptional regulator n=2 Tax=Nitrobacteraceae TaxID=41294 RepID=A0AAE9N7R8_9BRAD|nr:sigma-54-dependent Fis family transcriptional regulator [Bradyrhizobium sp. WBOS2]MDD1574979.1 sigma-54-dependent Fis family transcriptional regulator [Bradyrhizobium sp. WBOS1]MDD1580929.1 sigma-54-dependent Fis family transcriptional regulator [Bradyrhizobium sp. WBOS7]MDD1604883.1 sigma-54-dependent Fis family transcriptional regulator [Bradyrhizobium sp. WBOS16]UUO33380.1 sigma-54-dependent Fis family transcriptional regulator [Bradyrhizobium sp. WBOS01]UUO39558.1 sigma-54-dependent Fis